MHREAWWQGYRDGVIGDKVALGDARRSGGQHILLHIVAHHGDLLRGKPQLIHNVPIVVGIGLAERGVLIGGDVVEILRRQTHPAEAAQYRITGEDGVGGQHHHISPLSGRRHGGAGTVGIGNTGSLYTVELVAVKGIEGGDILIDLLAKHLGKVVPKPLLVAHRAIIRNHRARALPHGIVEGLRLIAQGGGHLAKFLEIAHDESLHIHAQQRAV